MRRGGARRGLLLLTLLCLCGCTSLGGGRWGPLPGGAEEPGQEPWLLGPGAYPTQRLFRVRYDGPEGDLSFKLTLYVEGETRFRMRASDTLGRRVWELDVDESDRALWLDHREKRYCVTSSASQVAIVPLARLPLVSLAKLLLGYLPAAPVSDLQRTEASVYYRDVRGQLWNGGLAGNRLQWWTLVEHGEAVTWWRREGEESVFVDTLGNQQLRWREVVVEPLAESPAPLRIPGRFRKVECG